uniref:C-myc promoter-binding protein n=1 Tax=Aceria tosichella TaxID=561515 RepID=A0A6G1SAZ4_9ACAR
MDERRVADYFIISGVPEQAEQRVESKPFINSVLPITDVTVIIKSLGEQCPIGYTCIEFTPGGHVADLNNGNFKSPDIHICYRRGNDKPPLVDVGVYHQDKDRVLPDVEVVYKTPYGRFASTGNSLKSGTFITFRRAKTNNPYNQLVVVDLCVILNNKSEHPPHAFYSIKKNLNKSYYGMIGSEVFLCYKKSLLAPPSLCYTPQIISRFPLQDCATFPLPDTVPLFCLPAGASIELRPSNSPLPRPVTSTFVLTSDSAQKIYGSALSFYEPYDRSLLSQEQKVRLGLSEEDGDDATENQAPKEDTYALKSICILSRWPFFDCFEKFLTFLHKLVFSPHYSPNKPNSPTHKNNVSLEHHISHFLLDVSFPTAQRPTVLVQLMPGTDETITISQPSSRLPLPLTGASFVNLLTTLGVENTMTVLLFGLCEQKILLHSLNPWLLTGVAEAITAMLFPFHWQCPYVPLCPLSLHGILNAPLPFIVGIDSRCFDHFTPPDDVICIDLDTECIFLSELKKCLNTRILPKRAAHVLRNSLEKIYQNCMRISQVIGSSQSPQHRSPMMEASRQLTKNFELEIQEAFVRFMATILRGFRSYLLPITRAPTVGATDPTSLFDFEGFLMSRDRSYSHFYQLITKTQMFTHYIEERSFVSDKDTSLAFFDDCEERLTASEDMLSGKPIKLFDKDDGIIPTDRSVYIPAPEQSPSVSHSNSLNDSQEQEIRTIRRLKFGPLNPAAFHRHPQQNNFPSLDGALKSRSFDNHLLFDNVFNQPNSSFSISRRTKQEVKASQKMAKRSAGTPLEWFKYLVSCCYCLWFSTLPSYITYCKSVCPKDSEDDQIIEKTTARILRYAHSTIVRMQKLQLSTDEICFRILTLLCGHYGQPALAVRVFFEMKKAGIKPNAVTYGYYNKAVLESRWPDHSSKPTTVLWTKIRNVISGIALFKSHGRLRMQRRKKSIHENEQIFTNGNHVEKSQPDGYHSTISFNNYKGGGTNGFFKSSSFSEESPMLHEFETSKHRPNHSDSVDFLPHDDVSTEETQSNKLSESFTDPSSGNPSNEDDFNLTKNLMSTPNFKLASLINDASNLQWSKWTSSHNSKSVYKGIKNAATGIVSSLQEIKSSFSISNSATPSKLLTTAQNRSTTTREMLSQWATQFGWQATRGEDEESDGESVGSNDLSDVEDIEDTCAAMNELRQYQQQFVTLEKQYNNTSYKEGLISHLAETDKVESDKLAIEIRMSTCSRCNVCQSLLFDEEIMERWSHHESNLNTKCRYCRTKIVPLMTIQVEDRRFPNDGSRRININNDYTKKADTAGDLVDLKPEKNDKRPQDPPLVDVGQDSANSDCRLTRKPSTGLSEWSSQDFTVPYLSPIVLRKELESVFESSGDNCTSNSRFVDEHPIIFWNLLWYFSRINVPTHLALLCLSSKSIRGGEEIPEASKSLNQVVVRTIWDNDKLLNRLTHSSTLSRRTSSIKDIEP